MPTFNKSKGFKMSGWTGWTKSPLKKHVPGHTSPHEPRKGMEQKEGKLEREEYTPQTVKPKRDIIPQTIKDSLITELEKGKEGGRSLAQLGATSAGRKGGKSDKEKDIIAHNKKSIAKMKKARMEGEGERVKPDDANPFTWTPKVKQSKEEKRAAKQEKKKARKDYRKSGQAKLTRQIKRSSKKAQRERKKDIKVEARGVRKATEAAEREKTGVSKVEQTAKKVSKYVKEKGKTKAGKVLRGAVKLAADPQSTDVGRIVKGGRRVWRKIKKGKIFGEKGAIRTTRDTARDIKARKKERKAAKKLAETTTKPELNPNTSPREEG